MWQCPKCKREFKKNNQAHSCVSYPIEKHFVGRDTAKNLFDFYISEVKKEIGQLKIESLPCCIHLVTNFTFGAVWAMKDGIRIDFRLDKKIDSEIPHKTEKISPNRFIYYFDIKDKKEINLKLINLVKEASKLNS